MEAKDIIEFIGILLISCIVLWAIHRKTNQCTVCKGKLHPHLTDDNYLVCENCHRRYWRSDFTW